MLQRKIFSLLMFCFVVIFTNAQSITVSGITTAGRFSTCASTYGQPIITATLIPTSPGSAVVNGNLLCLDPNDSSIISINMSNLRWNQAPNVNWLHGVFFPGGAGITLTGDNLGPGWVPSSGVTGASCSAGLSGGLGYYYDGTSSNSCCPGAVVGDGNPSNNWGVGTIDCPTAFNLNFQLRIKNNAFPAGAFTLTLRGTSDGATGCWQVPDVATNSVTFQFNTVSCNSNTGPVLCNPAGSTTLAANVSGTTYQWTMSTDSVNFNPISDNANYTGTATNSLSLNNIPSSWTGYEYRCVTDGSIIGQLYTLKFTDTWTGTVNSDWNNPGNWSCGAIPDQYTDAVVNSGPVNVTSDCSVRSVTVAAGVVFTVNPGVVFTIAH